MRYLGSLAPYVVPGLRSALARTFVDTPDQLLPVGPAVVVLDPDLQVHAQTAGAAAALLQLNPPDEPMTPIPAAAYNVAAALVAVEQGVPVGEPWARVHLGGSRWVTVKADRMGPRRGGRQPRHRGLHRAEHAGRAHGPVRPGARAVVA